MKNKNRGVVYTPAWMTETLVDWALAGRNGNLRIIDPACGEGALLEEIARRIYSESASQARSPLEATLKGLTGRDTDAQAAAQAKERLEALGRTAGWGAPGTNVKAGCGLAFAARHRSKFDVVIANPPYVRTKHLKESDRAAMRDNGWTAGRGAKDLYLGFIEAGLAMLRVGGGLTMVTPGSWLWSKSAATLRTMVLERYTLEAVHRL